jgi:hypothetical protein
MPAERITLLAIAASQETLITSVSVDPVIPRAPGSVRLQWDTTRFPNGFYQIGGEALSTNSRVRSELFGVTVTNP